MSCHIAQTQSRCSQAKPGSLPHRQRSVDRLWLRPGLARCRSDPRDTRPQREGEMLWRAASCLRSKRDNGFPDCPVRALRQLSPPRERVRIRPVQQGLGCAAAYTGSRSKRSPGDRRGQCGPGSSFALKAIRSTDPCNRDRPKQCRDRVRTSPGGPGCPLGAPRLEPRSRPRGMCPLSERRRWAYCTGQRPSASQRGDRGGRERGRSCMSRQVVKGTSVRLCYSRLEPIARSLGTQYPGEFFVVKAVGQTWQISLPEVRMRAY